MFRGKYKRPKRTDPSGSTWISAHGTGWQSLSWQHSRGYQECASTSATMVKCFTAKDLCWQRHIKTNAARYRLRRDADMAGVIVRRLQTIMRKPVALFGCLVAPKPAGADFLDFFTWDRMTVLVVAAFFVIPGMSSSGAIEQHRPRRQHAKMRRHLWPSKLPDPESQIIEQTNKFLGLLRNRWATICAQMA